MAHFAVSCGLPAKVTRRDVRSVGWLSEGDITMTEDSQNAVSRRNFIKGVIAAGAAVSSASYLFRGSAAARAAGVGAGQRRAADHAERQRAGAARRRDEAGNAGDDAALQAGADGHQARLRPRGVRRVHGAGGRCAAVFVLDADALGARQEDHDDRRAGGGRRHAAPGAAGRGRRSRASSARSACRAS